MKIATLKRLNEIENKLLRKKELIIRFIDLNNDKYIITESTIENEIGKQLNNLKEIEELEKGEKDTFTFIDDL